MEVSSQPDLKLLGEALGKFRNNDTLTDVEFIVGAVQQNFKAHKLVLASRSEVFFAMLYGALKHNTGEQIAITDIEPDTFEIMLR